MSSLSRRLRLLENKDLTFQVFEVHNEHERVVYEGDCGNDENDKEVPKDLEPIHITQHVKIISFKLGSISNFIFP